jgi:hypothetical protein
MAKKVIDPVSYPRSPRNPRSIAVKSFGGGHTVVRERMLRLAWKRLITQRSKGAKF